MSPSLSSLKPCHHSFGGVEPVRVKVARPFVFMYAGVWLTFTHFWEFFFTKVIIPSVWQILATWPRFFLYLLLSLPPFSSHYLIWVFESVFNAFHFLHIQHGKKIFTFFFSNKTNRSINVCITASMHGVKGSSIRKKK